MQLFVDLPSLDELKQLSAFGLIDGVTTNPMVAKKEGLHSLEALYDYYKQVCDLAPANVSLEVISTEPDAMYKEAQTLAKISDKAVIKVPMGKEGLQLIARLSAEDIRTNCTLVFTPLQALLAAKAGASYVSVFIGRLDDIHHEGLGTLEETQHVFECYDFSAQLLGASVRHTYHLLEAARRGIDVVTAPAKLLFSMTEHPLTDQGIQLFLKSYHEAIPSLMNKAKGH